MALVCFLPLPSVTGPCVCVQPADTGGPGEPAALALLASHREDCFAQGPAQLVTRESEPSSGVASEPACSFFLSLYDTHS